MNRETSATILATMHDLATAYRNAGKYSEAIRLFELVRDKRIIKLGSNDNLTLDTIRNLAGGVR